MSYTLTDLIHALGNTARITQTAPGSYAISSWCGQPLQPPTVLQVDDESLAGYLSTNRQDAMDAFGTDAERAPVSLLMSELTEAMESRDVAPLQVAIRHGRVDITRADPPPHQSPDTTGDFTWRLDGPPE